MTTTTESHSNLHHDDDDLITDDEHDNNLIQSTPALQDGINITTLIYDCATNHLNYHEPFLSSSSSSSSSNNIINSNIDHENDQHDTSHNDNVDDDDNPQEDDLIVEPFNLHDAMAATQLLDPKMDGCQIPLSVYHHHHHLHHHHDWNNLNATTTTTATTTAATVSGNPFIEDTTTIKNSTPNSSDRMVYPRPIPTSLDNDPNHSLLWNDLTIYDATIICIEIMIRLQYFLSGSSISESTFTCLYAHTSILSDMQQRLLPCNHNNNIKNNTKTNTNSNTTIIQQPVTDTTTTTTNVNVLEDLMQQVNLVDHISINKNSDTAKNSNTATNVNSSDTDVSSTSPESQAILSACQWSIFAATYAMVDLTDMIREIILNADLYEEEDFVVPTYNIPFYPSIVAATQEASAESNNNHGTNTLPIDSLSDKIDHDHHHSGHNGNVDSITILKRAVRYIDNISTTISKEKEEINNNDTLIYLHIIGDILRYEFHVIQILPILARLYSGSDLHNTLVTIQTILQTAIQRLNAVHSNMTKVLIRVDDDDDKNSSNNNVKHTQNNMKNNMQYRYPSASVTIQRTFDSYVLRPYVGNIPLRKNKSISQPLQSIHTLRSITTELDTYVCTILLRSGIPCQFQGPNCTTTTLCRIYRMLERIHDTNILCRSLLLLNLYFDDKIFGQYDLRDLISAHVQQSNPHSYSDDSKNDKDDEGPELNQIRRISHSQAFTEDTVVFLNRLAKPIYDTIKVRFLHRHRQRAYIEMVILPEWMSLYKEAQIFDAHYTNHLQQQQQSKQRTSISRYFNHTNGIDEKEQMSHNYFTLYVLTMQIQFMDRFLECGIEVGLFRNIIHDTTFAYWYRDYLLSALHVQLSNKLYPTSTDRSVPATTTAPNTKMNKNHNVHKETKATSKNGNKKKNHHHTKNGKHHHQDDNRAIPTTATSKATNSQATIPMFPPETEDMYELKVVSLKRHLCRKTIQYISLLRKVGVIQEHIFEFTSLKRIFTKRFELFSSISQPPPLSFDDYIDGMDASSIATLDLIQIVSDGYKSCRTMIDEMILMLLDKDIDAMYVTMSMLELRSLMKVCVGNMVYTQRLKQLFEKKNNENTASASSSIIPTPTINAKATFDFDSHNLFCIIKIDEVI